MAKTGAPLQDRSGTLSSTLSAKTDDGCLSCTLSPKIGEGEGTMNVFIQKHMTSILQPITEHVQELQRQIVQLTNHCVETDDQAERTNASLQDHENRLSADRAELQQTAMCLDLLRNEIAAAGDKQATLKSDHDMTKNNLSKLDARSTATHTFMQELRRTCDEFDNQVRQVQQGQAETNVLHIGLHDRLNELKHFHKGLNDRHLDLVKGLQSQKSADDQNKQAIRNLTSHSDKLNKEHQWSFMQLDNRTQQIEASLRDTKQQMDDQTKLLQGNVDDLNTLRTGMSAMSGIQKMNLEKIQQDGTSKKNLAPAGDLIIRLAICEEGLTQIQDSIEKDARNVTAKFSELQESVANTATGFAKHASNIKHLDKTQKIHQFEVQDVDKRLQTSEAKLQKVSDKSDRVEADIREAQQLIESERKRLDSQVMGQERLQVYCQETTKSLDGCEKRVAACRTDLGSLNEGLISQNNRLELAHEYIQGVSKGFQDTHRRVIMGEDGFLSPKASQLPGSGGSLRAAALPSLGSTRTDMPKASTGMVSPDVAAGGRR